MRIARELHDVVAHSMAMVNVQATAAGMRLAADPASAAEAIQAIRRASKSGLRELRTILEGLRQVDGGSPAGPVRAPRPTRRARGGTPRRRHADHTAVGRAPSPAAAAGRVGRLPYRAGVA